MTFSLSDQDVIGALNAQAEAGLNVTLIVDRNHLHTIQALKHPNIELLTRSSGEGHFHHKILVLDKTITWIGSANFTAESLGRQLNTMNIIHNKELSSYLYEEIDIVKGVKTRQLTPPPVFNVGGKKVELLLFPHVQNPFIESVEKQYNAPSASPFQW
jgi:phosphatidylserine/phosphatidylglycerophosphate/cardiolipin synthase-like enzyme